VGGPSEALTPAFLRRTVYGKVGRYKLDEYLQLFDFPSPAISAEKRFTTTVPLQRLFMMNSDFMQIEAEELAKKVATEANNRARVQKLYHLIYGRDAAESEIALALDYLKSEPMKEYDEFKEQKEKKDQKDPKSATPNTAKPNTDIKPTNNTDPTSAADAPPDVPAATEEADAPDAGMMAGVPGFGGRRGQQGGAAAAPDYTPTPFGRYAKVLLSSSEFMFIN
jgi:hypothetical protein